MPIDFKKPQFFKEFRFGSTLIWSVINGILTTVTGVSPLSLANAAAHKIKSLTQYGKLSVSGSTITCNNGELKVVNNEIVADGTPEEIVVQGENYFAIGDAVGNVIKSACYGLTVDLDAENQIVWIHGTPTWSGGASYSFRVVATKNSYWGPAQVDHDYSGYNYFTEVVSKSSNITSYPYIFPSDASVLSVGRLDVTDANDIDLKLRVSLNPNVTPTSWVPYHHETANAENLFAVDDIVDEQDIITGKVIRRTEAVVSDGTTPSGRYVGEVGAGNIIVKARETGYSGEIVSLTTEEETSLNELRVKLEPIQDLHGYDNPWPAGGGKNLLDPSKRTSYGSGKGQRWYESEGYMLRANQAYTFSVTYANPIALYIRDKATGDSLVTGNTAVTYTPTADTVVYFQAYRGEDISSVDTFQLELGSTATAYEPYSNICPISGHTDADVVRTGKNLLDPSQRTTRSVNAWFYKNVGFSLKAGVTYTFSVYSSEFAAGMYVRKFGTGGELAVKYNAKSVTYTPTEDVVAWFDAYYSPAPQGGTANVDAQLELGSTASDYQPYVGTTYPVTFGALGKNLVNNAALINAAYNKYNCPNFLKNNTTYTFSVYGSTEFAFGVFVGHTNEAVPHPNIRISATYQGSGQYETFTTPADVEDYEYIFFGGSAQGAGASDALFQIELGTVASPTYEPYNDTVYGGYYDFVSGKLVATEAKIVPNVNTVTSPNTYGLVNCKFGLSPRGVRNGDAKLSQAISNVLVSQVTLFADTTEIGFLLANEDTGYLRLPSAGVADVSAANSWVSNNDCEVIYYLETPIVYQLSPQAIETLRGLNNVWGSGKSVNVYVSDGELIVQVTPQKLKTAEGTNTLSWTAEVSDIPLEVLYY